MGQEGGFRVVAVTPRPAKGLFRSQLVDLTIEAVGAPSIPRYILGFRSRFPGGFKVTPFRLDFTDGERLSGVAPARDQPAPGAILSPAELRDLGWCRRDLDRRLATTAPLGSQAWGSK